MQTAIQVVCTRGPSLRSLIARRSRPLEKFDLEIIEEKNPRRNPGWMKVKGTERDIWGAMNISWDAETATLACRVINKRDGTPHKMVGRFVDFLLKQFRKRIKVISILQV